MPVPVLTVEQMRQWEQATWATGKGEWAVISQVGEKLAQRILKLTKPGERILILCGRGHNGDDARATVEHLVDRAVRIVQVQDPQRDLEQLSIALRWSPKLILDGLFGIGLNRPLDENWQRIIHAVNASPALIVSVDVPSGLNADTGEVMGASIQADLTITLGAPKKGLLVPEALAFTGRIEVEPDIGLIACPIESELQWTVSEDFQAFPPPRPIHAHKGSFGHLVIIAGSVGYHGAAVLAARAAQKAQPGLISIWTSAETYIPVASQLQAVMVHPLQWKVPKWPSKVSAFLIGPGLASIADDHPIKTEAIRLWQEAAVPVIVDASALDWLPAGPISSQAPRIITPHPGEAARMLRSEVSSIQQDRLASLRALSERFGQCSVVLKGHHTLIGSHTGPVYINPTGNPFLAQGGAGDVLAGFIAGWLAQPLVQSAHLDLALRFAVYEHGAAADRLQLKGCVWTPEDLVSELGNNTITH